MINKQYYLLITVVLVCFVSLLAIWIIFSSTQSLTSSQVIYPTPTLVPLVIPNHQVVPTLSIADTKLLHLIENRQQLSQQDQVAKRQIITNLGNLSGSPVTTKTFRVDYIEAGDLFQVELLTSNVQQDENDALEWFFSQGFTKDGICKLPVTFYVNYYLKQQGIDISPLAEGC